MKEKDPGEMLDRLVANVSEHTLLEVCVGRINPSSAPSLPLHISTKHSDGPLLAQNDISPSCSPKPPDTQIQAGEWVMDSFDQVGVGDILSCCCRLLHPWRRQLLGFPDLPRMLWLQSATSCLNWKRSTLPSPRFAIVCNHMWPKENPPTGQGCCRAHVQYGQPSAQVSEQEPEGSKSSGPAGVTVVACNP